MSLYSLQVLANHRYVLLLAEVAALLHDVGKFTDLHMEHHTTNAGRKWSNDDAYKAVIDNPGSVILLSRAAANIRKPDILNNVLNATSPKAADFLPTSLKTSLETLHVNLFKQDYSLAELIMLGMPGFTTHKQRDQLLDSKDGWLPALLGLCHNIAHVDKEDPIGGEQSMPDVLSSSAFGYEQQTFVINDPQRGLNARLGTLAINHTDLPSTRKQILETFECGLGDNRRPTNEVTLADWSAMVAALFKTALAWAILKNTQPQIRQWKSWKDKIIDHNLHWRLLRVNLDVLSLYAKAIKIADLLGYQRDVNYACQKVKQLVEEEYPLGNEIYRDTTGIYFTFPDLDLPADLAQEICSRMEEVEMELAPRIAVTVGDGQTATEELKGILAKARREAVDVIAQPFDSQNLNACWEQLWTNVGEGPWELCPICRLRPMQEGREACEHCLTRRGSRVAEWLADPKRTIWMDELADANGRVALLVGKFGLNDWLSGDLVQTMLVKAFPNAPDKCVPKNPSPARLRRIWETCQRFWTKTVEEDILARHPYSGGDPLRCVRWLVIPDRNTGWKENVPYDGTVDGKSMSLLWQKDADAFVTIINLQLAGEIKPGQMITVSDPDKPRKQISFTVHKVKQAPDQMSTYTPYLSLLASPDQFLALVPAVDALDIADKIREEYARQFGKVQNRLPLFLGIIFFPRKMPLSTVMDTALRMLESPLVEEQWTVECCRSDMKENEQYLRLSQGEGRLVLKVPTKMGDNTTDDIWYPYFFVEKFGDGTPNSRTYRFQYKGRWLVHVSDLKEGDVVKVTPSCFTYLWLEHSVQRYKFDPKEHVMLLHELPRLMKIWEALKGSGITDTGLRNVQALLETKASTWDVKDEAFKHLVETTLKEAGLYERKDKTGNPLPDIVTPDDVLTKRFACCLEIYLHILKKKTRKED